VPLFTVGRICPAQIGLGLSTPSRKQGEGMVHGAQGDWPAAMAVDPTDGGVVRWGKWARTSLEGW
jgi:hypothetical protein